MKKLMLPVLAMVFLMFTSVSILKAAEPALKINFDDLVMMVGDSVFLEVVYTDTAGNDIDTTATWKICPGNLGAIFGDSLLLAEMSGKGVLYAELDTLSDSVAVEIKADETPQYYEPELVILPDIAEIEVGDSVQFEVVLIDTLGNEIDTTGAWTLIPDSLGTIDTAGLFIGSNPGECMVTVQLDTLTASAFIQIFPVEEDGLVCEPNGPYVLTPGDTLISIGDEIRFTLYMIDDEDSLVFAPDSAVLWTVTGMPVGEIDSTGLFTSHAAGFGIIKAVLEGFEYSALVTVADTLTDSTGINHITITRTTPSPSGYTVLQELDEGEVWTIRGLPYPLNVLNNGKVYFPYGSLKEDIRIHIQLPEFAREDTGGVCFGPRGVVAAVNFQVFVNDTLVEPYYFETPLYVGLIYKRGLLNNLGIDPETLALYFAVEEGDSVGFTGDGIDYVTLDLGLNRIFSTVAHFSSLVVKGEEIAVAALEPSAEHQIADQFKLFQNYPNPFNPATSISYMLPTSADIQLTVYNILGQEIVTLVNKHQKAGRQTVIWDGRDSRGHVVPTGIYIYKINTAGFTKARKMIFMK